MNSHRRVDLGLLLALAFAVCLTRDDAPPGLAESFTHVDTVYAWACGEHAEADRLRLVEQKALVRRLVRRRSDAHWNTDYTDRISNELSSVRPRVDSLFEELREAALLEARALGVRSVLERVETIRLGWLEDPVPADVLARQCGNDLLGDQAYVTKDWRLVVVCPGTALLASDRPEDELRLLLGHELGHALNPEHGRDEARDEALADRWAGILAARTLRDGVAADCVRVRAPAEPLCDPLDDGVHGPGQLRIRRAYSALGVERCLAQTS